jgi:hypothetical protein
MKTKLFYFLMCLFAFTATNAQTISLIGSGVGSWSTDVPLTAGADGNYSATGITFSPTLDNGVLKCEVKFRQDADWTFNWGSASFPTGTGTQGGANIVVVPGTYDVTFNINTGAYAFTGGAPIAVVNLIGTAVTGGTITMSTSDGVVYNAPANTVLLAGNAQFSVDGTTVGALAFPSGTATGVATDFIPVVAGKYTSITYDNNSGMYTFVAAPVFPKVGIVGSAVPGGWPPFVGDDPNQMVTTDGITYTYDKLFVIPGAIVFRQDNAWSPKWDGTSFPTGPTTAGDIIVPAETAPGTYSVTLNTTTGAYTFTKITYSIVGDGVGGWPGDPGNVGPIDIHQLSSVDGINYTATGLVTTVGGAKFRLNNAWAGGDWGGKTFPSGTKTGDNIPTVAGTYDVTVNVLTGAYTFTPSLSVTKFDAKSFRAYPNPTRGSWNITSNDDITSVQVYDVLGKTVYATNSAAKEVSVNATELSKGVYFAKVSSANGTSTLKLIKE